MKKNTVLMMAMAALMLLNATMGWAQGMSVNLTGTRPDTSAMLDVSATNKGLLLPRMTTAQRNAIPVPATGLLVYQTDGTAGYYYNAGTTSSPAWTAAAGMPAGSYTGQMQYWNGTAWVGLTTGTSGQVLTLSSGGLPQWTTPTSSGSITTAPVVVTDSVTSIHSSSLTCGGNISSSGGASVTARGVCWSTSPNPTIALTTKTVDGTGTGIYFSNITGLSNATTYYIRAYATNSVSTAYGGQITIMTGEKPTLTTTSVTGVTTSQMFIAANISSDGGFAVTSRGICWGTLTGPTTSSLTTSISGTGTGSFSYNLTGLSRGTIYYVRAYATNAIGTAYGNEYLVRTLFNIGDSLGGGVVGYILQPGDLGYDPLVVHGLIVSHTNTSFGTYGCDGTNVTTNTNIGYGFANTVAANSSGCVQAVYLRGLVIGGFSDWYLPSYYEMASLYANRSAIGGYLAAHYWTSTQYNSNYQFAFNFVGGYFDANSKSINGYSRAVRSF